jgi:hypothetical protein
MGVKKGSDGLQNIVSPSYILFWGGDGYRWIR